MKSPVVFPADGAVYPDYAKPTLDRRSRILLPTVVVGILLILVTIGLAAATLAIVQSRLKTSTATSPSRDSLRSQYAASIEIPEVMGHLRELQNIANAAGNNRAVNTPGFNKTLDFIYDQLTSRTDFKVGKQFFYLRNFVLGTNPILITSIAGTIKNRTFSNTLANSEFYFVQYTRPIDVPSYTPITVIPNLGCSDNDWLAAGQIALVKRGDCTFAEKATLAAKYKVAVLLFYNDGATSDRLQPIYVGLGQANELPALFLSYALGQELADAAKDPSKNVGVRLNIAVADERNYPVGNICADTPTGDPTQTIVIGSHSDSVTAGPGINDNGSGSAANLALAIALARLFQTSSYAKYNYRVRFCWWGAEEIGLLGSDFHVKQAKVSSVVGERLTDYLINLNFDMLGSPNYIFGIYDGRTARNDTPTQALAGSNKVTALFREWFVSQSLPWDYTDFSGRSDYGPFLAEGIVAGGLFSGADETKTKEQRDRYDRILGQGLGGIAGAIQDPCYHAACDSIENINVFAYEKMVQAAAYTIESLARQPNLKSWLYPPLKTARQSRRGYSSINDYFNLPYL